MAEQTFKIEFDGYWRDQNKGYIPSQSGIYCVYECTHSTKENTVSLNKLIYIGEADNVHDRIANHDKYNNWKKHVRTGDELCFSFGTVPATSRVRCEAAMIFKHNPPENTEYKDSFPFDRTTISLSGKNALLTAAFTLNRT
jgi:excinuclease UvrABC nuclease subunit